MVSFRSSGSNNNRCVLVSGGCEEGCVVRDARVLISSRMEVGESNESHNYAAL